MKHLYVLIIFIVMAFKVSANESIISFRTYYYNVCLQKTPVEEFSAFLELHKERNDLAIETYRSVIWFLWADYYFNPFKKWGCFLNGKKSLELLVKSNPNNIELRFLRLTIQENIPAFLGYNDSKIEDRQFIERRLSEIADNDLQTRILNYLNNNSLSKIN